LAKRIADRLDRGVRIAVADFDVVERTHVLVVILAVCHAAREIWQKNHLLFIVVFAKKMKLLKKRAVDCLAAADFHFLKKEEKFWVVWRIDKINRQLYY